MIAPRRCTRLLPLLALPLASGGCDVLARGVAGHAGPVAASQFHLLLVVGAVLMFVVAPVLLLVPLIAWHYRLSNRNGAYRPKWVFSWILEGFIWIPPVGIVIGLAFVLWHSTHRLDPYRRLDPGRPAIEVQAVGLDWKWLFIYPDRRIAAVNRLVIPAGRPVHLSLTSGTVMQSLMVPQLAGQIYAMAGMTTQLNLAADRPGVYRGENTQFNGMGFQDQRFDVVALAPAEYDRWLARVRASAHPLDAAAYARLTRRSVATRPVFFSSVPDGLFRRIQAQSRKPTP